MPTINLALQGGGSHGAFTWGVLDRLLEDPDLAFEGVSGTSAGALNGAALVSGWVRGSRQRRDPRAAARESLAAIWDAIGTAGAFSSWQRQLARSLLGTGIASAWAPMLPALPPNGLALRLLRELLERHVDVRALHAHGAPRLYAGATQVRTGRAVIFSGARLTLDALLASACIPQLFGTVEIDGEAYWDGGYSVNPALTPLMTQCRSADVLLVQINPLVCPETPTTAAAIGDRVNELTFNASLLSQVRMFAHLDHLAESDAPLPTRRLRLHRIDGGAELRRYAQSTRAEADAALIRDLFALGRDAAGDWLARHRADLGRRTTVRVEHDYADDTWLFSLPTVQRPRKVRRARPAPALAWRRRT